jgi:hypothetical protein
MGSSAPTTVMPKPTAPTVYKSYDPQVSFQAAADYLKRLQDQTNEAQTNLYAQSGTPGEIAAQNAATRLQAASTYAGTVPVSTRYVQDITGVADQFAPMRQGAMQNLSQAQEDYSRAMEKALTVPKPAYTEQQMQTPSWAKIPDSTYVSPPPPPTPPKTKPTKPPKPPKPPKQITRKDLMGHTTGQDFLKRTLEQRQDLPGLSTGQDLTGPNAGQNLISYALSSTQN